MLFAAVAGVELLCSAKEDFATRAYMDLHNSWMDLAALMDCKSQLHYSLHDLAIAAREFDDREVAAIPDKIHSNQTEVDRH